MCLRVIVVTRAVYHIGVESLVVHTLDQHWTRNHAGSYSVHDVHGSLLDELRATQLALIHYGTLDLKFLTDRHCDERYGLHDDLAHEGAIILLMQL